ncbi:hypothetical protein HY484_03215 [Candidatus Woesearchaeota archaeon]|nr:hypothetical protein [Candidatus Woesearchaeota archaeon]
MHEFEVEKVPALIKRCPKCFSLSLDFDVKTGVLKCSKCSFEQRMKMVSK